MTVVSGAIPPQHYNSVSVSPSVAEGVRNMGDIFTKDTSITDVAGVSEIGICLSRLEEKLAGLKSQPLKWRPMSKGGSSVDALPGNSKRVWLVYISFRKAALSSIDDDVCYACIQRRNACIIGGSMLFVSLFVSRACFFECVLSV